ncbi:unnamed protein product [Pieris brassicae]|uniref:Uncharacterized protein n=1 Tax=Pieris brassicae TaxID=7116 RepID=A0A9P0T902_PIEBR|nr:unnamed protein product [Pieris brassicae]
MSGGQGSARRPPRSGGGGGGGGTLPASGFTYVGNRQPLTLNNGAPAPHLNNGSLRSLPDKGKRNGTPCRSDDFKRNLDARYSRKQDNAYPRASETVPGLGRGPDRDADYGEPEYSVIAESFARDDYCSHSNTFNC